MIFDSKFVARFLATAFLLLTVIHYSNADLQVGDTICAEGYIMDFFCINRGTLLDNPSVRTLENPGVHSFHCLVDVNSCVTSPFEILLDPMDGETIYKRGWRLDEESKQEAIALAQSVGTFGFCSTCNPANTNQDSHREGFRMAVTATILDLNENDATPPLIRVDAMQDTTVFVAPEGESACSVLFGAQDVLEEIAESDGSSLESIVGGGSENTVDPFQQLRRTHFIHASLMIISWGFLLPSGTLIAKFFKHRPDGLWYKLHRGIQMLGLSLAIAGWIYALINFNVFLDYGFNNRRHGICGMVVMVLGILQPLNAIIRPHAPKEGATKSTKRFAWEIWHKTSGWIAVILAVPTIVLGTLSLPLPEDQKNWQIGYGVGCIGGLLGLVAYMFYDKKSFQEKEKAAKPEMPESAKA